MVTYLCDHFVYSEKRFLDSVQRAILTAGRLSDRLVLLGVTPDHLELDYGWLEPGEKLDRSSDYQPQAVRTCLEKPTVSSVHALLP